LTNKKRDNQLAAEEEPYPKPRHMCPVQNAPYAPLGLFPDVTSSECHHLEETQRAQEREEEARAGEEDSL
jgi:hypothetical protein